MTKPKDPSLIPPGSYCYRWVELAPGEVAPTDGPEFGRLQREGEGFNPAVKKVLCPYFEFSGYGTARCLYLGEEGANDFFRDSMAPRVAARFGRPDAVDWFDGDGMLWDMIKICRQGGPDESEEEEEEQEEEEEEEEEAVAEKEKDAQQDAQPHQEKAAVALSAPGLLGPFAPGPRLPGRPRSRQRHPAAAHASPCLGQPRFVQAAVPAFTQLRAAMSEVASHPWWCFQETRAPFWRAGKTLQSFLDQMPHPGHGPAHVMNLLDWPDEAKCHVAGVAMLVAFGRLQARVEALRQSALANGRWWPAPESIELMLVFESWVGLRMRFPPGYQPPWARWIVVWHPIGQRRFAPPLPLPTTSDTAAVAALPRRPPVVVQVDVRITMSPPPPPRPYRAAPVPLPADPPALPGCVWLLQTHVAGMAYHQANQAMGQLREGSVLQLRREPANPHDALAIEVLTDAGLKLGYVPQNRNPVIARLMDAGQTLQAQVLSVGTYPRDPQPWQTPLPEVRLRIDWRPAEPNGTLRHVAGG